MNYEIQQDGEEFIVRLNGEWQCICDTLRGAEYYVECRKIDDDLHGVGN